MFLVASGASFKIEVQDGQTVRDVVESLGREALLHCSFTYDGREIQLDDPAPSGDAPVFAAKAETNG